MNQRGVRRLLLRAEGSEQRDKLQEKNLYWPGTKIMEIVIEVKERLCLLSAEPGAL